MMSPNSLTAHKVVKANIGKLPLPSTCPTATKIFTLYTHLRGVLVESPSFQSTDHGYQGMVDFPKVYALTGAAPWIDFPDPGVYR